MTPRRTGLLTVALAAIIIGSATTIRADDPADTPATQPAIPQTGASDTSDIELTQPEGAFYQSDTVERHWPKPTPTLLKSMVFPGWGQFTNRKYAKAALVFGLETWYIGKVIHHWRKSNQYLSDFRADADNLTAFQNYDFHRGTRNDYMWWLGITVFVSMFDAYVDAHLQPYDQDRIPDVAPPPGIAIVIKSF